MHPRNKNRDRYDLKAMLADSPGLKKYIVPSKAGGDTVNFADASAVKALNKAILKFYYGIDNWEFSKENLLST